MFTWAFSYYVSASDTISVGGTPEVRALVSFVTLSGWIGFWGNVTHRKKVHRRQGYLVVIECSVSSQVGQFNRDY